MKLSLCLFALAATLMMLTGCRSEPDRPAAENQAPPAVTMNTTEPDSPALPPPPEDMAAAEEIAPGEAAEPAPAAGESSGLTREFLSRQKFVLVQINEADYSGPEGQPVPSLEFGEDFLVSGRICNNYRGPGELQDGVLSVRAMASTRMMCPDTNLNQLETRFFQMLENGAALSMNGDRLTLRQGDNSLVFKAQTGS